MSAHSLFYSSSTHSSHNYSTRSSMFNLPTPLFKSTAGQRCPFYQLPFLWNNLPTNIKQISNSLKFKTTLKNHLLSSWLVVWLWHQWLMTHDSHGASTLLARLQCILAPSSSMGVTNKQTNKQANMDSMAVSVDTHSQINCLAIAKLSC